MLKNPQASILISSYNKGNYLEQCIKSCLSQTQKNIEVVLLDNFSNDKTNVVLKKFSKKVKILKKKRISKFPALNQIDLLNKAFKEINSQPKINLDEGLDKTIHYFKNL